LPSGFPPLRGRASPPPFIADSQSARTPQVKMTSPPTANRALEALLSDPGEAVIVFDSRGASYFGIRPLRRSMAILSRKFSASPSPACCLSTNCRFRRNCSRICHVPNRDWTALRSALTDAAFAFQSGSGETRSPTPKATPSGFWSVRRLCRLAKRARSRKRTSDSSSNRFQSSFGLPIPACA